jgi:hypothetical protein
LTRSKAETAVQKSQRAGNASGSARRAWSAGDKEGAILPVAVFVGCWQGVPFLAGLIGQLDLAYFAYLGPPVALVLGFRLVLLHPPKT